MGENGPHPGNTTEFHHKEETWHGLLELTSPATNALKLD